jgi:Trm5-related predicted tRNA methylase
MSTLCSEWQKYGSRVVYLSPDATEELQTVDEDTYYCVGGLVDKRRQKVDEKVIFVKK